MWGCAGGDDVRVARDQGRSSKPGDPDEEQLFLADARDVIATGHRARESIESALAVLQRGADEAMGGAPLPEVIETLIGSGARQVRLHAAEAFEDFERAIGVMRARFIKVLVDVCGMSLTEAGRRLNISRQAAARLYRQAEGQ